MDRRRKKILSHGPSYNRLHGAPPSSLATSASSPCFSSRPRVHFDDSVFQSENRQGCGISAMDYSQQSPSTPSTSEYENDPELERVMRHYGLDGTEGDYNIPTNPSFSKKWPEHSEHNQRLASFGVSLSSGLGNALVAYPFIVMRRQCQVNHIGRKYHLTPFTIVGVALNLQRAQGVTCLWKGIGSNLMVNALTLSTETAISELSCGKFPRDVTTNSTIQTLGNHLILKAISSLIVAPFFSAHLVESVQSEMVSEVPGIFSCLTDGASRLFGRMQSQRLLPFYKIILPTLTHSLLKYVLTSMLQQLILHIMRWYARRKHEERMERMQPRSPLQPGPSTPDGNSPANLMNTHYPELISGFIAELACDIALYPMETIVHRINIQGTRTIIDNTDTGRGFLPVSSRYEGFWDCFSSTITTEGYMGLYRGFGALTLQYGLKYCLLRLTKFALEIASPQY